MKRKTSIVLLSGGLDSTINLKKALDETEVKLILTFNYGQESRAKEIESSKLISQKYNLEIKVITLDFLSSINSSLKNPIPDFEYEKLDDLSYSTLKAKSVWVPNRNSLFINIAAAYAEKYHIELIVTGFNKEEAKTFPDNSEKFLKKINELLKYSTIFNPIVISYTSKLSKIEIVKMGEEIDAPFEYIWSCYRGGEKMCGNCESCQRLKRALKEAGFYETFCKKNLWGFEK